MRVSVVLAVGLLVTPASVGAWGFDVHRFVTDRAIELLPPEIRPFFDRHRVAIVEHSIDPDLWRTAGWEEEPPRHFVDMDAYGPYPFVALPREFDEAVERYGREFVLKNGTLPWRTAEIHARLVDAFAGKGPYSRENIKFFSSVLAHYVADAHVPFHAALNYDGQLTGQWGIHARFETELFERYRRVLRVEPGPIAPIAESPRDFVFARLLESFPLVQPVLDADRAAVAGRELYDDQYFDGLFGKVEPILTRRLSESITGVASIIADAWTDAGRPAVPLDVPLVPRRVRRQ
ncbi:MAG TPA: hypothetical protein VD833_02090 [Vicinamibacterales bacterium]|nr:hypothetical protein [Vicinamibacterales bacterium]